MGYDDYQDFCRTHALVADSGEAARQFLLEIRKYPESVVRAARMVELARDTDGGVMTVPPAEVKQLYQLGTVRITQ